jgi:hypothetical protein
VYTFFGSFPSPAPAPSLSSHTPFCFQAEPVLPLSLILFKRRYKHNKKDKVFLPVDLRTAIQKDSSFASKYKCVTTQVESSLTDLYTDSWSPSPVNLCHFKVSVLAPLEWRHQTLSWFGFSTYPRTSRMCSLLSMWPKSNHIVVFALDRKSTYEGEHTIFGLLSLVNLTQNDVL